MLTYALWISWVLLGLALALNLYRMIVGPSLLDRVLALDTMYINSIAVLILMNLHLSDDIYFEAALLIALIGFVSTVALAKYMLRGDIIE